MKNLQMLGKNYYEIRKMQGYTIKQMAEFLRVSEFEVKNFEKGKSSLGVSLLENSCNLFGCTLAMLNGQEKLKPLPKIRDAEKLVLCDLEAVAASNKIVLNLRYMEELE